MSTPQRHHNIAVWGPSQVGKTTYLIALVEELKRHYQANHLVNSNARQFNINTVSKFVQHGEIPGGSESLQQLDFYLTITNMGGLRATRIDLSV